MTGTRGIPILHLRHKSFQLQICRMKEILIGTNTHVSQLLEVGTNHLQADALHNDFQTVSCHLRMSHRTDRDEVFRTEAHGIVPILNLLLVRMEHLKQTVTGATLLETGALLVVTSALLVVTRSY